MSDTALLERTQEEVSEIREFNGIAPGEPVKYEPEAVNHKGFTD